jgi:hypothetical protein
VAEWKSGRLVSSYAGTSEAIKANIESIIGKTKSKKRLPEAPQREKIEPSKTEATPDGAAGSGVVSPLTEQPYDGTLYYQIPSSDGLFIFEYSAYTDYTDGAGNDLRVIHLNPEDE